MVAVAVGGALFWRFTPGSPSNSPLFAKGGSSSLATARFADYGLSFRYPANWKRLDCQLETTFTDTITFLTNAPSAECSKIRSYKGRPGLPAIHLGADGVLVYWLSSGFPGRSDLSNTPGRVARIGGMPARIRTLPASACAPLGGDAGEEATIKRPTGANNWFTAIGCFRGPNVAAHEAAFRQLLASVRLVKS